jgi:hypothetical protein
MPRIPERDPNHAKCDVCEEFKEHVDSGAISKDGKLIFIADRGTRWRGRTCPDCVDVALVAEGKNRQQVLVQLLTFDKKPRVCRECNHRVLPLRRYRVCEFCQPSLNTEVDEDFVYHDMDE